MPKEWSAKDERQYKHVKESEKDKGRSTDRAEEIAARTVNKQRSSEGRTESKMSRATGNPNSSLKSRTKSELLNRAAQLHIRGRSSMNKDELAKAIGRQQ